MTAAEYLKLLDFCSGVSGSENNTAETIKKLFSQYCDEVTGDRMGNIIGIRKGKKSGASSVLFEAHMDELGLMVSKINEEGSLGFIPIGGFDPKVLPGTEVTVRGKKNLFGVIGAKPPHLIKERTAPKICDMAVDIGLSKEKTAELVNVGDIITINTSFTRLKGDFVAARCIDNRGGLAMIMRVLELLSGFQIENDVCVLASVQEEVGLRGARVAAFNIKPSSAVSIDTTHGTSPSVTEDALPCGKGPVIELGPTLNRHLTKKLISLAKENKIDFQTEVSEGDTGTDAWEIQTASGGVPVGLLSIPLRYMHGNYEVADCRDIENGARLLAFFASSYKEGEFSCF